MEQLKQDLDSYFVEVKRLEDIPELIEKIWNFKSRLGKLEIYANLTYYQNILNEQCIQRKKELDSYSSLMLEKIQVYEDQILSFDSQDIFAFLNRFSEYSIFLRYVHQLFFNRVSYSSVKHLQEALNSFVLPYNSLRNQMNFGSILVEGEEKQLNFQNLRMYQTHSDRNIRKMVFEKILSAFHEKRESFFSIIQNIFSTRKKISELSGYSSIRAYELSKSELSERFYFH